jgi:acyl-CoA thioesterase
MAEQFSFDIDTLMHPPADGPGPGRWTGTMSNRWDIGDKPNGGYMIALAVRAMAGVTGATPAEHIDPFSVTAHYLRPGEPGTVEVDVDLIRTGRTLSTATATMTQGGKEKLRVIGTFGRLDRANGPTVIGASMPDLPSPDECLSRRGGGQAHYVPSRFSDSVDVLLHPDTGWVRGVPSGRGELTGWMRFTDGRPADVISLALLADAFPPTVFEVLPAAQWVPTVELTVHFRGVPAPGWLRARFVSRYLINGFFEEDGEIWDSTGQLVAQSRQLAMVLPPTP